MYGIIRRRKWVVALATLTTVIAAIAIYQLLPRYYQASVLMMPSERALRRPASVGDVPGPDDPTQRDEQMATLVTMARSRTVCAGALAKVKTRMSYTILQRKIKVERVADSSVGRQTKLLQLGVVADSPSEAVLLANAVASTFCEFYSELSHREAVNNRKFLEEQVQVAQGRLNQAEKRLKSFRETKNIASLPEEMQSTLDGLTKLRTERDGFAAELTAVKGRLGMISRQLAGTSDVRRTVEMTSEGSASSEIRAKITDMEEELAITRSRYTSKHPKVKTLEAQLERARAELDRNSSGLVSKETVTPNPDYYELLTEKRKLQADRSALNSKVAALNRAVAVRDGEMLSMSGTDVDLSRLMLDYKTTQEDYSAVLARLNHARISENLTTETGALEIVDPADRAQGPFRKGPDPAQLLIASVILGVILGVGFSAVGEMMDSSIRTPDHARDLVQLPISGVIPALPQGIAEIDAPRVALIQPESPEAESFRFLATDLLLTAEGTDLKSMMVATAKPNQGGTVTISNLAITLAHAGKRVVLIDVDFRRPKLHKVFDVENTMGFSNVLSNGLAVTSVLRSTGVENLELITSGSHTDNPWKLLRSHKFAEVLDDLKQDYDFVLLDSPSAAVFADAITMSSVVDGVILVIRANQAPRGNELQLKGVLNKARANIVGVVLNSVSPRLVDTYQFYEHYYSSDDDPKALPGKQEEQQAEETSPTRRKNK